MFAEAATEPSRVLEPRSISGQPRQSKTLSKSHLNYVVADSKWESAAAFHLDQHPRVAAFVKNQGLGFAIPYLHGGGLHEYIPDFLVRVDNGRMLILEAEGGRDEKAEIKVQAAERWVAAVNADGRHGEWSYAICRDPNRIPDAIAQTAGDTAFAARRTS